MSSDASSDEPARTQGKRDTMGLPAEAGQDPRSGAQRAGGFTAIPRWAAEPVRGVAEQTVTVPDDVAAALRRLTDQCAVPPRSAVLAAHAAVLAALCGERQITTGYVAEPGGPALPCRLDTGAGSWRTLLRDAERESGLLAHRVSPENDPPREQSVSTAMFETVFDPTGTGEGPGNDPAPTEDVVLWLGLTDRPGGSGCGCAAAPTCSTGRRPPGSPGTTSPRSPCSWPTRTPTRRGRACCRPRIWPTNSRS